MEKNVWLVVLALPFLLFGGVYLLQAILSAFNGSTADGTVAGHLRAGIAGLAIGGAILGVVFYRDRSRR